MCVPLYALVLYLFRRRPLFVSRQNLRGKGLIQLTYLEPRALKQSQYWGFSLSINDIELNKMEMKS